MEETASLVTKIVDGRMSFNNCGARKEYSKLDICKRTEGHISLEESDIESKGDSSLPLCKPINQIGQRGKCVSSTF